MQRRLPATSSLPTNKGTELVDFFRLFLYFFIQFHEWVLNSFVEFLLILSQNYIKLLKTNSMNFWKIHWIQEKEHLIINSQNDVTLRLPPTRFINNSITKKKDMAKILHQPRNTYIANSLSLSLWCCCWILSQLLCGIFLNADTIYVSFKYNNNKHMMKKTIFLPSKKKWFLYFFGSTKKHEEEKLRRDNFFLWANTRIAQEEGVEE